VADVLTVAAVELGDPVAVLILVVTDDAPLQMPSVQAEGQIVSDTRRLQVKDMRLRIDNAAHC
jgi:hypothetical protein